LRRSNSVAAAAEKSSLDDWSAGDQTIDDHDNSDDEQEMDQSSTYVHDEESENPKDEQNYRDGPKHDGILARSELRVARHETSRAWRTSELRLRVMLGYFVHYGNQHA
jgi:hypothetical protein